MMGVRAGNELHVRGGDEWVTVDAINPSRICSLRFPRGTSSFSASVRLVWWRCAWRFSIEMI